MVPIYIVKKEKAWYCISIFYARSEWPALIKEIISFYNHNRAFIDLCLIYLSTMKGEHIKVTFSSDIDNISLIENKISEYFTLFLIKSPSVRTNNFSEGTGIWTYYPNNTVVWNQYEIEYTEAKISQSLTTLLLHLLDDDMSIDNTFSVALFLSIKLVKSLNSQEQLRILNEFWDKTHEILKNEVINYTNEINYDNILNTIKDYWELEFEDDQSIMLFNHWISDVKKTLLHYSEAQGYSLILEKICVHLQQVSVVLNYILMEWYIINKHYIVQSGKSSLPDMSTDR